MLQIIVLVYSTFQLEAITVKYDKLNEKQYYHNKNSVIYEYKHFLW